MRGLLYPYLYPGFSQDLQTKTWHCSSTLLYINYINWCFGTGCQSCSIMKHLLFIAFAFMTLIAKAQTKEQVTLKGGTIITVAAVENLKAANCNVGDRVNFKVVRDVKVDGKVAIAAGTLAFGKVTEAKRSSCFGTKGRLSINLSHLTLPDGETVPFTNSNINITGKNLTPVSIVVFCFTLLPLPCGTKAVLKAGTEYEAMIANTTLVEVEK